MGSSRLEAVASCPAIGLAEGEWPGEVRGDLSLDKAGERITVRGKVRAVAHLDCVRCLRSFELPVEAELLVYADRAGTSRHEGEEDALVRDHYMKFHDGRRLDLGDEVRESLLLEQPMTPHCTEDCRGLCPRCGADLNQGPCAHAATG